MSKRMQTEAGKGKLTDIASKPPEGIQTSANMIKTDFGFLISRTVNKSLFCFSPAFCGNEL